MRTNFSQEAKEFGVTFFAGEEKPRLIVMRLGPEQHQRSGLNARLYCARGESENRIKIQMKLSAYRMSTESISWLSCRGPLAVAGLGRIGELEKRRPV